MFLGILLAAISTRACGPDFPNTMLDRGETGVLAAPIADFYAELERIHLTPAHFRAVITTNDHVNETIEAEVADLQEALSKNDRPLPERQHIVLSYQTARLNLAIKHSKEDSETNEPGAKPKPPLRTVTVPDGLPVDFADYFRGCIAWHAGNTNEARTIWEALLQRPDTERHYRSTWAAYMLGKYWQGIDSAKAIDYFQKVRILAGVGFSDRLGLAASSIGWEAQEVLHQKRYQEAIALYLQQLSSGDNTAATSLNLTASEALAHGGAQLSALAADTDCRRVITAYITSRKDLDRLFGYEEDIPRESNQTIIDQWLNAVEAAKVTDMESAEQLALAAYNVGKWDYAQRWIDRSKSTPVTEWLEAKLLLREGKVDKAAALLEKVARGFPLIPKGTNEPETSELKDNMSFPGFTYVGWSGDVPAAAQLRAEMGALHLSRREFTESLDALTRAGFWMDAAYVAERVLTIEELKVYVDRNWPVVPDVAPTNTNDVTYEFPRRVNMRSEIRYLLARRMARAGQRGEAMDYYPIEQRTNFAALIQHEQITYDANARTNEQAAALFELAKLVRHQGMELLGTEVEPDWHIHEGQYYEGVTVAERMTNSAQSAIAASDEELDRARQSASVPDARFHYRYQAADLAWKAAKLMPDNTEETARVLCIGGTWLKTMDAQKADVFYKALVRRCRKTEIGNLADRRRWFPELDENGKLVPWTPLPPQEVVSPEAGTTNIDSNPTPGYWYILNRGNSLQDVIDAVNAAHQLKVTTEDILKLNPGINLSQLKAGQKILTALPAEN